MAPRGDVIGGTVADQDSRLLVESERQIKALIRDYPIFKSRRRGPETLDLKTRIAQIPEFPKPGILFYDISPLLGDAEAWREAVRQLAIRIGPYKPDLLIGIESRGFLVAAPLAYALGSGFAMVRKKGKLPGKTVRFTYDLEYGSDTIEIQEDAIAPGQRVIVVDDLIATGGTTEAAIRLVTQ